MVQLSLSEWIASLHLHNPIAMIVAAALILFIWQYSASKQRTTYKNNLRLERLHRSLELYTAAIGGMLREVGGSGKSSPQEHELLVDRLLACKAAPYATDDLSAQVTAYTMNKGDMTRLTLLLRSLERETERLEDERHMLLNRMEKPGWGWSLWQQILHTLPFVFTTCLFLLVLWFIGSLYQLPVLTSDPAAALYIWSRFLSCLFALLLLYPFLRGGRRETSSSLLQRWLAVIIALAALLHMTGLQWAPYVFTLQLLLFLAGFRFSKNKPRKSRPFAGHYFEAAELASLEAQLAGLPDSDDTVRNADTPHHLK